MDQRMRIFLSGLILRSSQVALLRNGLMTGFALTAGNPVLLSDYQMTAVYSGIEALSSIVGKLAGKG